MRQTEQATGAARLSKMLGFALVLSSSLTVASGSVLGAPSGSLPGAEPTSSVVDGQSSTFQEAETPIVVVDATKIYHGKVKKFKSPALVDSAKVYEVIPAYQYIKENNLTEDDPMYWFKMKEASKTFAKGLKKLQKKKGHDLVAEIDAIYREDGEEIPDVTDKVKEIIEEGV